MRSILHGGILRWRRGEKSSRQFVGTQDRGSTAFSATSSTADDQARPRTTPSIAVPRPSGQEGANETSPAPTVSQLVPAAPPLARLPQQHGDLACDKPKLPEPYANNYALWAEALQRLKESERHKDILPIVEGLAGDPYCDCAKSPDVKSLAVDIQKKIDEAFKRQQHDSKACRIIGNAISVLSKFTSAVDVAVSFDPVHAALPWAAVRSVLLVLAAGDELKNHLLAGIAKVTSLLVQCETYQQLYMVPDHALRPPEAILSKLKTSIVQAYTESQLFLGFAIQRQQSKIKLDALFKLGDVESHVNGLAESEEQLLRAADNCERQCDLSNRANVEELLKLVGTFDQVKLVLERIDENDQLEILEWISPIPYGKHHSTVKEARTSDTCEWLLQHERFRQWEDTSSSVIMWLQGSPGTGKTFLTSKVIDHVQSLLENSPNQEGFAYFYCNRNEEERRKPLSVLRSYVRQLSTTPGNPGHMRKQLRDTCRKARLKGSDLNVDVCKDQLLESVNLYPKTTLVLDALDECESESRHQLVEAIEFLLSKSERPLKIFISSRPDGDIREHLASWPNIEIQATDNQEDIEKFVNGEIVKHRRWNRMSPSLREEVVETLLYHSSGMFQWAYLQIKQLLEHQMESAIRDRLGKLPIGLKNTYDEIYGRIEARNKYEKVLADRAFMWIMCACKPLSSTELMIAIRLDPDNDTSYSADVLDEDLLLELCNNLLVIDSQRKVWRFSHLSVAEYFEGHHWDLRQAHCHAAKVCLKLLIMTYENPTNANMVKSVDDEDHKDDEEPRDIFDPVHPFQIYSRHHWAIHVRTYETRVERDADPMLPCLLKTFIGSPGESSAQYLGWYRQIVEDQWRPSLSAQFFSYSTIAPVTHPVFCMCVFGIYSSLSDWWEHPGFDAKQTNSEGWSLLSLAIHQNHPQIWNFLIRRHGKQIVNISDKSPGGCPLVTAVIYSTEALGALLRTGANPNLPLSGDYGSALAAACHSGKSESIRLLLGAGAEVNMPLQGKYGSALAAACQSGRLEAIQLLLDAGAEVNMPLQGEYGSALVAACHSGKLEAIRFLLDAGAEVNMPLQGEYGSALAAAVYGGKLEVIRLLLDAKAEVNMQLQGEYGSALATACHIGKPEAIRLLLDAGAEVNMPLQGEYGSALAAACYSGKLEAIRFLLDAGAEVNMPLQGKYGSPLAAACYSGKSEGVRLLLDAGAEVNMPLQGEYGSALAAACHIGKLEAIRFLLDAGAEVNMPLQGKYGSPLAAACHIGKLEAIRLLLDAGAEVNMQLQGEYGSPLAAACYSGKLEAIRLLLDAGAEVNMPLQGEYGSPLAAACYSGKLEAIRFLLDAGAEVNMPLQGEYGSALAAAIYVGELEAIQLLLDGGADANMPLQGKYGSALSAAAIYWGKLEAVRLLLDAGVEVNILQGRYGGALAAAVERPIYSKEGTHRVVYINEHVWIQIGKLSDLLGNEDDAMSAYEHALSANPNSVPAMNAISLILRSREDFKRAIEYLHKIIKIEPNNGEALASLGHCYLMLDDLHQSYAMYQSALARLQGPTVPKLWYGIGILYDKYGFLDQAQDAFSRVLQIQPDFEKANEISFRLGIIYKQQNKYDQSLECFKYIINSPPPPLVEGNIWFQIGHVHEIQKDYDSAKQAYQSSLEYLPNDPKVLQQLGWLHHQGFISQVRAVEYLEKSVTVDNDPQSWYLLGRVYMSQQKYSEAKKAYQQAVSLDDRNPTFWCSLGILHYEVNQYEDAFHDYSRAIYLNPYIPECWYDLGTLYEFCNQITDARDAYQRAADLDSHNPHIKARLQLMEGSLIGKREGKHSMDPGKTFRLPTLKAVI